jgi:hypothetical protein
MRSAALKASTLVVPVTKAAKGHAHAGAVVGRAVAEAVLPAQIDVGQLAAARVDLDAHVAHFAAGDLPGEAEPVMEAVLHPVGGELRRQEQVERAGFLAEAAELDRLDPLAVKLVTEVLAQSLAYVRPVGGQVQCFLFLDLPHSQPLPFHHRHAGMLTHSNHRTAPSQHDPKMYPRRLQRRQGSAPRRNHPSWSGRRLAIVISM